MMGSGGETSATKEAGFSTSGRSTALVISELAAGFVEETLSTADSAGLFVSKAVKL